MTNKAAIAAVAITAAAIVGTGVPAAQAGRCAPVHFAAVGDSITAMHSRDFAHGDVDPHGSWVTTARRGPATAFVGGWAQIGAITQWMADGVRPVPRADVLVVLAGTNDSRLPIDRAVVEGNLQRIVRTVGAPRVILSSIPPQDADPANADRFNHWLRLVAARNGWHFVNSTRGLAGPDGRYLPGLTVDHLHTTPAGARMMGRALRSKILSVGCHAAS